MSKPNLQICAFFWPAFLLLISLYSCKAVEIKDDETSADFTPPKITGFEITDSYTASISFSKDVAAKLSLFAVLPGIEITGIEEEGPVIKIQFMEEQVPGREYHIKGTVTDNNGNTLSFGAKFYGFNPDIPGILINEFTTQGSAAHPDKVEFFITRGGNTAGLVFYHGCSSNYTLIYVFPPVIVETGDYIILHTKPQGIPAEIDETLYKDESGGLNVSPDAWDLWIPGGTGLSGNNGMVTLYSSYGGAILDAAVYSNRTSVSDERYRGFGSTAMMVRADCIAASGAWVIAEDLIRPEDCINPDSSTATRSINRDSSSLDTDSKEDWHIVPTSGSTFGYINRDDVYSP